MTSNHSESAGAGELLAGRFGFVFGVAHKTSIAWAIVEAFHKAGMGIALAYQGERQKRNVDRLVDSLGADSILTIPCDVTEDDQVDAAFEAVSQRFGRLDCLVHSIAFADKRDLEGSFSETSREGFLLSQNVSAYSLTALSRRAVPLFRQAGGGSVITLTYLGGERVVRNYNMMGVSKASLEMSVRYLAADLGREGIRVNAISAGPIKTLSARGVSGFTGILDTIEQTAPLGRNVKASEVGDTALFLASDLSSGITGEVIHVDAGYHIMGVA